MAKSKILKIKNRDIQFTVSHCFKLSPGGYFILPLFVFSFGLNGFGIHCLGFYLVFSITKN